MERDWRRVRKERLRGRKVDMEEDARLEGSLASSRQAMGSNWGLW